MSTLGTEATRPSTAAQVLSTIAIMELPHNLWPDVMSQLDGLLRLPAVTENLRVAVLETIGYICEGVVNTFLFVHLDFSKYLQLLILCRAPISLLEMQT